MRKDRTRRSCIVASRCLDTVTTKYSSPTLSCEHSHSYRVFNLSPHNLYIPLFFSQCLFPTDDTHRWDFMTRTMWMLAAIPNGKITSQSRPTWVDIISRVALGHMLIDNPAKLESMNRSAGYNHDQGVEFGDEVKRAAAALGG